MEIYTVSQIAAHVKDLLIEDQILRNVAVSGEVSNLLISQSGHAYFTLKDSKSQIRCVMFSRSTGMALLDNGKAITAHGHVSFYEARGTLDLVTELVVEEGIGPLALEYERLKSSLAKEGLFDTSRKRHLVRFPQTIGLITSPTGAVLHDIVNVLNRRYPVVKVLLAPTLVQGPDASIGIKKALESLNHDGRSDLIIMARGGGSLEELWSFNEESVARAIFASVIPVVSAIGHETDFTIADFVADVRAPTPSAAAEMVVPDKLSLEMELGNIYDRITWNFSNTSASHRHKLSTLISELHRKSPDISTLMRKVDDLSHRTSTITTTNITLRKQRLDAFTMELKALSPIATLDRGYAVVQQSDDNQVIHRKSQVKIGDSLKVTVRHGNFFATVDNKEQSKRHKKNMSGSTARLFP